MKKFILWEIIAVIITLSLFFSALFLGASLWGAFFLLLFLMVLFIFMMRNNTIVMTTLITAIGGAYLGLVMFTMYPTDPDTASVISVVVMAAVIMTSYGAADVLDKKGLHLDRLHLSSSLGVEFLLITCSIPILLTLS